MLPEAVRANCLWSPQGVLSSVFPSAHSWSHTRLSPGLPAMAVAQDSVLCSFPVLRLDTTCHTELASLNLNGAQSFRFLRMTRKSQTNHMQNQGKGRPGGSEPNPERWLHNAHGWIAEMLCWGKGARPTATLRVVLLDKTQIETASAQCTSLKDASLRCRINQNSRELSERAGKRLWPRLWLRRCRETQTPTTVTPILAYIPLYKLFHNI